MRRALLVCSALAIVACHRPGGGPGDTDGGPVDPVDAWSPPEVDSGPPVPPVVVSGPEGASITVPADGVPEGVTLAIDVAGADAPALPEGVDARGTVLAITPHGTALSAPATIRIPIAPGGADPVVLWTAAPGGAWSIVRGAARDGDAMVATVDHFSYFVAATPARVWSRVSGLPARAVGDFAFHLRGLVFATVPELDAVYVSDDRGATWTDASIGLPTGSAPTMLALWGADVWAATSDGPYVLRNATGTWARDDAGLPPSVLVYGIDLVGGALTIGVAGPSGDGRRIWRNSGGGWTPTVSSPNPYVAPLTFVEFGGGIFMGTANDGVLVTYDGGVTWSVAWSETYRVDTLVVWNGELYAGGFLGLRRYDGGAWTSIDPIDGVSSDPALLTSTRWHLLATSPYFGAVASSDGARFADWGNGLEDRIGRAPDGNAIASDGTVALVSVYLRSEGEYATFRTTRLPDAVLWDVGDGCTADAECSSGHCGDPWNRCTTTCASASECPSAFNWSCTAGLCTCRAAGDGYQELCNGVDDDCDGRIDVGNLCPAGQTCVSGSCT